MKQTTDLRQDALMWWHELTDAKHRQLLKNMGIEIKTGYEGIFASDDEIEQIYLKETSISKDSLEGYNWSNSNNSDFIDIDNNNGRVASIDCMAFEELGLTKDDAINEAKKICEAVNNYNALKDILKGILEQYNEPDVQIKTPIAYFKYFDKAEELLKNLNK